MSIEAINTDHSIHSSDTIADVQVRIASTRYTGGLRNSLHDWSEKHAVLAFVRSRDGVQGVGEAWCDSGDPALVAGMIARDLAPRLIGRPLWAIEDAWARMATTNLMSARGGALFAAISAVDIALWDALARSAGLPLHRLLGRFAGGSRGLRQRRNVRGELHTRLACGRYGGSDGTRFLRGKDQGGRGVAARGHRAGRFCAQRHRAGGAADGGRAVQPRPARRDAAGGGTEAIRSALSGSTDKEG